MVRRKAGREGEVKVAELPELPVGYLALKNLFKAGGVPREFDYVKLIEYVHYLHKLIGIESDEPDHVPTLGDGLVVNDKGVLSVEGASAVRIGTNESPWIRNLRLRLGGTHIAFGPGCVIFFVSKKTEDVVVTIAHGFAINVFMFPELGESRVQDFKLNGVEPMSSADSPPVESLYNCSEFTLAYECEVAAGNEFSFWIKLSAVSLAMPAVLNVEAVT